MTQQQQYLTLYQYTTQEGFEHIIRDRRLKLSLPECVNDVQEGSVWGETKKPEHLRNMFYICLSATCQSPSLWAYYANSSRGVCLAFTLPVTPYNNTSDMYNFRVEDKLFRISRVQYIPQKLGNRNDSYAETYLASLYKSQEWMHEKEFRMIIPRDYSGVEHNELGCFTDMLMPYLSGVILGPENAYCTKCARNFLQRHGYTDSVEVVQAELAPLSYYYIVDAAPGGFISHEYSPLKLNDYGVTAELEHLLQKHKLINGEDKSTEVLKCVAEWVQRKELAAKKQEPHSDMS